MSANDDGFGPVADESGDVLDDDGLSEDGSVEVISDGAVGGLPHFFQFELLDSGLVGGDGGTLDANFALLDGFSCVHGDLVVGLISVLHAQIKVLDVKIEEGMDEFVFDELPEDSGHFISVQFGDGVGHLYFLAGEGIGKG